MSIYCGQHLGLVWHGLAWLGYDYGNLGNTHDDQQHLLFIQLMLWFQLEQLSLDNKKDNQIDRKKLPEKNSIHSKAISMSFHRCRNL
ncbi:hypothetical protein DERF_009536 [Dermatophagoides farinae]|uniref:Uncharacterized protein n=1 Tax=Dermatophagoides farinae TaxID=6954 RepID=A0A922HZC8_DERFA|nr:hypothetical protein DERF_009536 [Dermatophagoides farinae]